MPRTAPYRTSDRLTRTAPQRSAPYRTADGTGDADAFARFRDAFAGSTLHPRWSVYKPASVAATAVSDGRLRLTTVQGGTGATGSFWYSQDNTTQNDGGLIYQTLGPSVGTPVGFDVRARIRVLNGAGSGQVPETVGEWRFGGIAVHHPTRTSYYRYLHMALGSEGGAGVSGLECKVNRVNAEGGASVFPVANIVGDLERDLRIVRRATDPQIFDLFDKPATGSLHDTDAYTRRYTIVWNNGLDVDDDFDVCPQETDDPFPDDVQVGIMNYSNATAHDILTDCLEFWAGETTL